MKEREKRKQGKRGRDRKYVCEREKEKECGGER